MVAWIEILADGAVGATVLVAIFTIAWIEITVKMANAMPR